jgi:uncharacterized membrane protein YheB (UPF0754 family)
MGIPVVLGGVAVGALVTQALIVKKLRKELKKTKKRVEKKIEESNKKERHLKETAKERGKHVTKKAQGGLVTNFKGTF